VAPGAHLQGLRVPGSFVDQSTPPGVLDARFQRGSGTSESAAIVSGAIALVLQKHPDLTPDQVKKFLFTDAKRINGADDKAQGAGRISLADLLNRNPDAGGASQHFDASTGTGSLEQSRGSDHLTLERIVLHGEIDIFGHPFDARAVADPWKAASSWNRGTWNSGSWSGNGFGRQQPVRKLVVRQRLVRQLVVRQLSGAAARGSGNPGPGNSWSGNRGSSGNSWSGNSWSGDGWAVGQPPGERASRAAPRAGARRRATGTLLSTSGSCTRVLPIGTVMHVDGDRQGSRRHSKSANTANPSRGRGRKARDLPGRPGPSADRPVASHLLERPEGGSRW
jgi:serine protease AprX